MKRQQNNIRHSGQFLPSPRLLSGIVGGWAAVVALVGSCILLGMNWAFQRNADGLPTPVLSTPAGNVVMAAADSQTTPSLLPTALPTIVPSPATRQTAGANVAQPTLLPNQDPGFGYGIQPLLERDPDGTMDRIAELGMNWVKVDIHWAAIQAEPDTLDWTKLDQIVSAASTRNLKVLATISAAPDWTRSVTVRGKDGPPDNVQAYVSFVSQVIQRYRGTIQGIEIWSDENLDVNWYSAGGLNPSGYLNLLIPASQAIRQIDPGIIIMSGALTPTGRNDGVVAVDDFAYMQQLIDGGLLDYVDCVGVHHSGFNLSPTITAEDAFASGMPRGTFFAGPYDTSNPVNPHHSWAFYSTLNGYHNLIVAAKKETPLCVTRFGWASADGYSVVPPGYEFARDNTLQEQSLYIVRAFQNMQTWGFVRLAILNNLDYSQSTDQEVTGDALFSIIGWNNQPRPAFFALRDMPKPP